ncbi:MAG: MerR family transcriptional regulator [Pseudomonadota bacterium]
MKRKTDNALRTISETAEILSIPVHVIRFWETKLSVIRPVKYNNRRYYSTENINILKEIKELLYIQKLTIKDVIMHFKKKRALPKSHILLKVKTRLTQAKNRLNAILQQRS